MGMASVVGSMGIKISCAPAAQPGMLHRGGAAAVAGGYVYCCCRGCCGCCDCCCCCRCCCCCCEGGLHLWQHLLLLRLLLVLLVMLPLLLLLRALPCTIGAWDPFFWTVWGASSGSFTRMRLLRGIGCGICKRCWAHPWVTVSAHLPQHDFQN